MTTIQLGREIYSPTMGTFGWVDVNGWRCWTMEEIWRDNRTNVSCIPVGTYRLKHAIHHISTPDPDDDYDVFEIMEVPGRSAIHIHVAQTIADVKGCVGLGDRQGTLRNHWAVMSARATFAEFMERMAAVEAQDADLWIAIGNVAPIGGTL